MAKLHHRKQGTFYMCPSSTGMFSLTWYTPKGWYVLKGTNEFYWFNGMFSLRRQLGARKAAIIRFRASGKLEITEAWQKPCPRNRRTLANSVAHLSN